MPNPTNPQNLQAQVISANLVTPEELKNELQAVKEAARSDGHNNAVIVDKSDTSEVAVYNLSVEQDNFDQLALNQQVNTGNIQGTIKFLDSGHDDLAVKKKPEVSSDPLYDLDLQAASTFAMALEVWGYGDASDQALLQRDYSSRERTEMLAKFQQTVGVTATGQWDVETFAAAKTWLINEYDHQETLTDGQFRHVIDDLLHFAEGKLSRDDVADNLDEYLYEGRETPYTRDLPSDTAGFEALQANYSKTDQMKVLLSYLVLISDFLPEEAAEIQPLIEGQSTPELRTLVDEGYMDVAELEAEYPDKTLAEAFQAAFLKETQDYFDLPEEQLSGVFDQATYDGLLQFMYTRDTPDLSNAEFFKVMSQMNQDMLAYANGEMDVNALRASYNRALGEDVYELKGR